MPRHPTALIGMTGESRGLRHLALEHRGPCEIHPDAIIGAYVTVDAGTERSTEVRAGAWLFKHVHIGHDAIIEEDVEIAPGTVIAGFVIVRKGVKIGINASVLPYVCIGEGAVIGAGAVVTRHVLAGTTVFGNPAQQVSPPLKTEAELRRHKQLTKPGNLRCGCWESQVWDHCPHHGGSDPVC